ncbi:MAG: hypothetical protein ACRDRH_19170 [Pseudonocardia sp.]
MTVAVGSSTPAITAAWGLGAAVVWEPGVAASWGPGAAAPPPAGRDVPAAPRRAVHRGWAGAA